MIPDAECMRIAVEVLTAIEIGDFVIKVLWVEERGRGGGDGGEGFAEKEGCGRRNERCVGRKGVAGGG